MRTALAIGCVCALAAGCGSAPRPAARRVPELPRSLAQQLARESDALAAAVAAGDSCRAQQLASQLRADATASIGRVPPRFREPLSSGVNEVVAEVPACAPPPAAPAPAPPPGHEHGPPPGRGGHGQGRGHGHGEGD